MPRACTICNHKDRKTIDAMIANCDPYLQIATKFKLNQRTVNTHGKNHVKPFLDSIELQASAAVLERVMSYRDEVNLPLPEKAKYVENKLWADYEAADKVGDRMTVIREIQKQQAEQAKLTGAYIDAKKNPADVSVYVETIRKWQEDRGKTNAEALEKGAQIELQQSFAPGTLTNQLIQVEGVQ